MSAFLARSVLAWSVVLFVGCVGLFIVDAVRADGPDATPTGSLTGRVVTLDGRPVTGARVWIEGSEKPLAEAKSDADGRFRLGPIAAAYRYSSDLLVEADGLGRRYVDGVSVLAGADHDVGDIVLQPGRLFAGQVSGPDGMPLAGARVKVTSYRFIMGHTWMPICRPWELTTDADGRFRTPTLPVGKMEINVHAPGCRAVYVRRAVLPEDGGDQLDPIRLENDRPIPGVVLDEDGRPIAAATVWLFSERYDADQDGRFVLRGLAAKPSFQLIVTHENYVTHNKVYKDVEELTIKLIRPGWIIGRAVDAETGEPVRVASVTLCQFERQPDGSIVRRG